MKELEAALHVVQSTASGIASRLESKGMIESFGDPDNKKIKIVGITDKGKELCTDADAHMKEAEKYLLHELSATEREEFVRLLAKVSESL
jgi:DNA-binding MarR family transcriptional regulator